MWESKREHYADNATSSNVCKYLSSCSWMYFPKRLLLLFRSVEALPKRNICRWWGTVYGIQFSHEQKHLCFSYQKLPLQGWSPALSSRSSPLCPDSSPPRQTPLWHSTSSSTEMSTSRKKQIIKRQAEVFFKHILKCDKKATLGMVERESKNNFKTIVIKICDRKECMRCLCQSNYCRYRHTTSCGMVNLGCLDYSMYDELQ